jgi:LPS export ABC transporter protein LptC
MRRAALVALLGACALAGACIETDTPPLAKGATAADTADQFLIGMSVKLNDAGVQRAEIRADSAYFYNENTLLLMRVVHSQFFTSTGVQEGLLTSKAARYDTKTDLMEATGDVVLVAQDGRRLTTQQLIYNKSKDLIHSDSAFKYTTPDGVLEGVGFDSDPGMNSIKTLGAKGKGSAVTLPKR